ncbi:MAG: hypothetical protein ACTSO9_14460 [Candidatus Helarchaeota archaeon]
MKENYGYFIIAILIWIFLAFLFSFIINIEPKVILGFFKITQSNPLLFIASMVVLTLSLLIYGIGYINYKLDEKPYALLYCINSCPIIIALIFFAEGNWFFIAFIFIPIIFNTIFLGILGISSGVRLEAFHLKPKETMKYILFVFVYYIIVGFAIFLYWVMGMSMSAAPSLVFSCLFYALNFIILIPLI